MRTQRFLWLVAAIVSVTTATVFTSCSSDDEYLEELQSVESAQTRSTANPDGTVTINFDDFASSMMAMPTSYGGNYYGTVGSYPQVTSIGDGTFTSVVNTISGTTAFWNGGIALSKWNYYGSNPSNMNSVSHASGITQLPQDWWYSYYNQMSVYNTTSTNGANTNAGHSGNNFAVVYGYKDSYNAQWMDKPSFAFDRSYNLKGLWICNSSYTYGVIMNGNSFGSSGVATPLSAQVDSNGNHIGYFQVELECYDSRGQLQATYTKLLADYRGSNNENPVTSWTYWPINQEKVRTVKFNFSGSDSGTYGLNTPAYLCIDDIILE